MFTGQFFLLNIIVFSGKFKFNAPLLVLNLSRSWYTSCKQFITCRIFVSKSLLISSLLISLLITSSTCLYVNLCFEFIIDWKKLCDCLTPLLFKIISTVKHNLSTFGFNEHKLFDNFSGSIGITRFGKYTELPLSFASWSR